MPRTPAFGGIGTLVAGERENVARPPLLLDSGCGWQYFFTLLMFDLYLQLLGFQTSGK